MKTLETKIIANIVKVELEIIGEDGGVYSWETASKATITPFVHEGEEEILRVKNRILAINRQEDLIAGYDIEFEDNAFVPEIFAIIDGGELIYDDLTDEIKSYKSPKAGEISERKRFNLSIYTEEKDLDGFAKSFLKFSVKNCLGKPATFDIEDGQFVVPSFSITSRPRKAERALEVEFLESL